MNHSGSHLNLESTRIPSRLKTLTIVRTITSQYFTDSVLRLYTSLNLRSPKLRICKYYFTSINERCLCKRLRHWARVVVSEFYNFFRVGKSKRRHLNYICLQAYSLSSLQTVYYDRITFTSFLIIFSLSVRFQRMRLRTCMGAVLENKLNGPQVWSKKLKFITEAIAQKTMLSYMYLHFVQIILITN